MPELCRKVEWYGFIGHVGVSLWSCLSQSNKQPAKDFFHFHPLKQIAPELGVSAGAVRDWRIFLNKGDFAWISERNVLSRRPQVIAAVADWITNYPIGYTDAAKAHGVRPLCMST